MSNEELFDETEETNENIFTVEGTMIEIGRLSFGVDEFQWSACNVHLLQLVVQNGYKEIEVHMRMQTVFSECKMIGKLFCKTSNF